MQANVVVVGAGAGGCVIAARLSERSDCSVLLLEAGPDSGAPVQPWPRLLVVRTPEQAPTGYTRGFGVGGSAALNAMVANLGQPDDYDEWERAYGCSGWNWRDVRPWFRRIELPRRRAHRDQIGALSAAVLGSAGATRARLTRTRDGRRAGVKEVYLDPARKRANLTVRGGALVDRVLFEGHRAVGVLLAGGEVIDAGVVVVCAGAIHTPAILLRSAVDREGVGRGLHDHPSLSVPFVTRDDSRDARPVPVTVISRTSSRVGHHDAQLTPIDVPEGSSMMAAAMRVHSRGIVRLASQAATADPIVEFNMLTDERDLDLLRTAAEFVQLTARLRSIATLGTIGEFSTTDEALRGAVGDYFHAAGSCRMGDATDPMAVVDERCRVIGYQSLLVCDASVMPNLPRASPCLPTVMIAERVSAMMSP